MNKKSPKQAVLGANVIVWVKYLLLTAGAFVMCFPFIWMIATSFKTTAESVALPPTLLPTAMHWENFAEAWNIVPFLTYFRNTVFVALAGTVVTVIFTVLAAYAFTIFEFRGKNALFLLFLSTMMIPAELLIIQNYVTVTKLGWIDSFRGIIIPTLASGFYIYMMKEYFMQVPRLLYKAAKVDGCSDWKYLWRVMVPVNRHAISTIFILNFIAQWNAFIWPMIVTNSDSKRVLSVGLLHFRTAVSSQVNLQMAGSTIVILPMVIFYLMFSRKIINGVSSSGIKG